MKLSDIEKKWRAWKRENPVKLPAYSCLDRYGEQEPVMAYKPLKREGQHHAPRRTWEIDAKRAHCISVNKSKALRKKYPPEHFEPRPGEQRIKAWAMTEAERKGVCFTTIWKWLKAGKYPNVIIRKVTDRIIFVREPNGFEI